MIHTAFCAGILTKIMHMRWSGRGYGESCAASVLISCKYRSIELRSNRGSNSPRQRRGKMANHSAATPSGRKPGVPEGRYKNLRSASALMSPTISQAAKRAAASGDISRTGIPAIRGTHALTRTEHGCDAST